MTPFSQLRFETPRLVLRPLDDSDAADLYRIFSDPLVMRYWSSPAWTEPAQAHRMIERDQESYLGRSDLRLAIEGREPAKVVGTVSLFRIDAACRRAEIGYALGTAWQGRGLMNESLRALIDAVFDQREGAPFDDLRLNRLEADVDPRNGPSCRSLERVGFQLEGRLRERWWVDGEVSDSALYGLLRAEWPGRSAGA